MDSNEWIEPYRPGLRVCFTVDGPYWKVIDFELPIRILIALACFLSVYTFQLHFPEIHRDNEPQDAETR
jgi:hypothetical protein